MVFWEDFKGWLGSSVVLDFKIVMFLIVCIGNVNVDFDVLVNFDIIKFGNCVVLFFVVGDNLGLDNVDISTKKGDAEGNASGV